MHSLFEPIQLKSGAVMKNRFMLAPLTNQQSHRDGRLSEDEFHWLTMRAQGGFAITMTCAVHVQANGQGFPGQLGIFNDDQLEGHRRLAAAIKAEDSLAMVQLHHAGMRSPAELIDGPPLGPSANEETGVRALTTTEVETLRDDFIAAAQRAERAGYSGVEVHGAHGYILCQFLSSQDNQRDDTYGGSLENRTRLIHEIIDGIAAQCSDEFIIGLRLSPERFGMRLDEVILLAQQFIDSGHLYFLDMSLWNCFKMIDDPAYQDQSLISAFTELDRKDVLLTVAGKIYQPYDAIKCMQAGVDFVTLGRVAIVHHDYPKQVAQNSSFKPETLPVTRAHLRQEGLSEKFIDYMSSWADFVED